MEEKKYLKWYNKVGYGSGDIAGNVVYAFLTSFVMIYLTETVGLASGIVGTLIAFSKLLDGFTDVFFGSLIDKTHQAWESTSVDAVWIYRLRSHAGCMLCGTDKPWQDSTVYVVLSGIHTVKWHFLHGK